MSTTTRYWVNMVSQDHVHKGVVEGFLQASRGEGEEIEALAKGDLVVFYSPRTKFRKGTSLQEFTAIGKVEDEEPFVAPESDFKRRGMSYLATTNAAVQPLVGTLSFLPNEERWELPYSKGLFQIEAEDFAKISEVMGCSAPTDL